MKRGSCMEREKRKKQFLNREQKEKIKELKSCGKTPKEIAVIFNTTPRHIRDVLRSMSPDISNKFTEEEEMLLVHLIQNGNYNEWTLKKHFFQNKMPYTIRNKIKTLKKRGVITKSEEYPIFDMDEFYSCPDDQLENFYQ